MRTIARTTVASLALLVLTVYTVSAIYVGGDPNNGIKSYSGYTLGGDYVEVDTSCNLVRINGNGYTYMMTAELSGPVVYDIYEGGSGHTGPMRVEIIRYKTGELISINY